MSQLFSDNNTCEVASESPKLALAALTKHVWRVALDHSDRLSEGEDDSGSCTAADILDSTSRDGCVLQLSDYPTA